MFDAVEGRPGRTIAAVGLLFALAYAGAFLTGVSRGPVVRGDAIQYYAYLRSAVFDRDLDFQNEYEHFYAVPGQDRARNVWLTERTPAGRPPNMMSIGPAVLWSPAFLTMAGATWGLSAVGVAPAPDGYSMPMQLSAGLAGVAYGAAGAWLCWLAAASIFGTRSALWASLTVWLAGPAVYYSVISPAYSHATSLFAVSAFVVVWLRSAGRSPRWRAVALGALGGLAMLVRWQDAIVLLLPGWEFVTARLDGRLSTRRAAGLGLLMAAVAVAVASPQLIAWQAIYGQALVMPQGGSFMRWGEPAILSVLFSTRHGLFLWTPALLVAAAGLAWLWRRDRRVGTAVILTLGAAVYVNAAVSDWWAGEAFGARRFVSYGPLFTLGLAAVWTRLESARRLVALRAATLGLIAYNLLFLLQYQVVMRGHVELVPYPETLRQILVDRLFLPWQLLGRWLHG